MPTKDNNKSWLVEKHAIYQADIDTHCFRILNPFRGASSGRGLRCWEQH